MFRVYYEQRPLNYTILYVYCVCVYHAYENFA